MRRWPVFSWQPTLSSPLVTLRPLARSDWAALFAAASDPAIWAQHPEPTRYQEEVFGRFFEGALQSRGALVVEDAATGAVVGSSRYTNHRADTRSVEIGYTFLTRPCWGGAYNRDVKRLMLAHAFTQVDTVWFVVGTNNLRSRGAMTKIGGVLAPAEGAPVDGDLTGHVLFRIDRDTWAP